MRPNTIETVMARVEPVTEAGCWIWMGPTVSGYGVVQWQGLQVKVHRLMWEIHNGAIPVGMLICHRCDTPPCCNPAHLFLGDARANVRDAVAKGRHAKMVHTHCPQGHEYTPENTRTRSWKDGRQSKFCVECYRKSQREHRRAYRAARKAS